MPPLPLSVSSCQSLITLVSRLVPYPMREAWAREWHGRIWHQWQFLHHEQAWNRQEDFRLFRRTFRAIPQAFALWWLQESVQEFQNRWLGSPWAAIFALCALLLVVAVLSGGLPATKLLLEAHSPDNEQTLFVLLHPAVGGGDKPLPADVVPAWNEGSHLLGGVAPYVITRDRAFSPSLHGVSPVVIRTTPELFCVLRVHPAAGQYPSSVAWGDLVVDYPTAVLVSHLNTKVIGSGLRVGNDWHRIAAVLPKHFRFLTRQPVAFLVNPVMPDKNVMVVARASQGTSKKAVDRELTKIAEDKTYYFFASQLRYQLQREAILLPIPLFLTAALSSAILALIVCGVKLRDNKRKWTGTQSRWAIRRTAYLLVKTALALLLVFVAGLEASRTSSSILLSSRDPANGPLLLWFYIAATMAVFFWSIAEGRMRCRTCLRRLCSPVRVGSPGCLLLDWSGTELICNAGHGVLHVPHMTTSWQSDAQNWITMDESWQELFAEPKRRG